MTLEQRMGTARDKLKAAQEKAVELTTNSHRSLITRSLYLAVKAYSEAVDEAIDILDGDK